MVITLCSLCRYWNPCASKWSNCSMTYWTDRSFTYYPATVMYLGTSDQNSRNRGGNHLKVPVIDAKNMDVEVSQSAVSIVGEYGDEKHTESPFPPWVSSWSVSTHCSLPPIQNDQVGAVQGWHPDSNNAEGKVSQRKAVKLLWISNPDLLSIKHGQDIQNTILLKHFHQWNWHCLMVCCRLSGGFDWILHSQDRAGSMVEYIIADTTKLLAQTRVRRPITIRSIPNYGLIHR